MEFRTGPGLTAYIPILILIYLIDIVGYEKIKPKPNLRFEFCAVPLGDETLWQLVGPRWIMAKQLAGWIPIGQRDSDSDEGSGKSN